ncbi:SDR family NAD(P)-dependent oxidoreductase [Aureibacter tunicatorum]|uniref:NAD(P)-dependent dehydrogenase (Short-subunit alcohol dehydrogenase family) n=1 Tax=Aureibacter tunicatorum TaxID=866807 RepID=A0AAE3XH71_9BACT|nr:SDR family NAD(P)-dependent oxidoreductase [Aureibacter tunicatorum]MDR6237591.1 NAD(P)-dependent dehydrogenase (short-subunit alcohol dehydrogenase family) [Aureibacter tunicatorum]BDD02625.1 alcohol dehydrogenase [Aureibacter tunicatorum]
MKKVLLTGCSSGIGLGLAKELLAQGHEVYGLSRRTPKDLINNKSFHFCSLDLNNLESISQNISVFLQNIEKLDIVVLNAGILGDIKDMKDTSIKELNDIMQVNVWANKVLLDSLFDTVGTIEQVVGISSGAAVNGNRGWSGYAISKASFNMLIQLYAAERAQTHFSSLAPGLVDTAMQDYLCGGNVDSEKFSSIQRLKEARGTEYMPSPEELAKRLLETISEVSAQASGSFIDIRKFNTEVKN